MALWRGEVHARFSVILPMSHAQQRLANRLPGLDEFISTTTGSKTRKATKKCNEQRTQSRPDVIFSPKLIELLQPCRTSVPLLDRFWRRPIISKHIRVRFQLSTHSRETQAHQVNMDQTHTKRQVPEVEQWSLRLALKLIPSNLGGLSQKTCLRSGSSAALGLYPDREAARSQNRSLV